MRIAGFASLSDGKKKNEQECLHSGAGSHYSSLYNLRSVYESHTKHLLFPVLAREIG